MSEPTDPKPGRSTSELWFSVGAFIAVYALIWFDKVDPDEVVLLWPLYLLIVGPYVAARLLVKLSPVWAQVRMAPPSPPV